MNNAEAMMALAAGFEVQRDHYDMTPHCKFKLVDDDLCAWTAEGWRFIGSGWNPFVRGMKWSVLPVGR